MPLISISKASKLFDVSRPTLQKALSKGEISGKKVKSGGSESWQIDTAELGRIYKLRASYHESGDKEIDTIGQSLVVENLGDNAGLSEELAKEVESLRADLAKAKEELGQERVTRATAEALAEERKRVMDEFIKLLPRPEDATQLPTRRGLWSRLTGR